MTAVLRPYPGLVRPGIAPHGRLVFENAAEVSNKATVASATAPGSPVRATRLANGDYSSPRAPTLSFDRFTARRLSTTMPAVSTRTG